MDAATMCSRREVGSRRNRRAPTENDHRDRAVMMPRGVVCSAVSRRFVASISWSMRLELGQHSIMPLRDATRCASVFGASWSNHPRHLVRQRAFTSVCGLERPRAAPSCRVATCCVRSARRRHWASPPRPSFSWIGGCVHMSSRLAASAKRSFPPGQFAINRHAHPVTAPGLFRCRSVRDSMRSRTAAR